MLKSVSGRMAAASAIALAASAGLATPVAAKKIENSYICVFSEGALNKGQETAAANRAVQANGGSVKHVYSNAIRGFAANISAQGAARMQAANKHIAYCEQDQVVTTVQRRGKPGGGGGGSAPAQETPWGITRVNGGTTVAVGRAFVIDSGVDLDHPDLRVNQALSKSFTREKDADDKNGHGTHVAGTIGAIDNNIGVVGVVPNAEIVAVKVLTRNGSGSTSGVIAGVDYVAGIATSGDVANMSLGGGVSTTLDQAVINASAVLPFALAAGNERDNADNHSPARANGPNIYTVSSFAQGDVWSSFSNFGNPPVDYAGPGSSIQSTYKDGGYATLSGTSMASPHVAGLLLLGRNGDGTLNTDGTVLNDPDGNDDLIAVR